MSGSIMLRVPRGEGEWSSDDSVSEAEGGEISKADLSSQAAAERDYLSYLAAPAGTMDHPGYSLEVRRDVLATYGDGRRNEEPSPRDFGMLVDDDLRAPLDPQTTGLIERRNAVWNAAWRRAANHELASFHSESGFATNPPRSRCCRHCKGPDPLASPRALRRAEATRALRLAEAHAVGPSEVAGAPAAIVGTPSLDTDEEMPHLIDTQDMPALVDGDSVSAPARDGLRQLAMDGASEFTAGASGERAGFGADVNDAFLWGAVEADRFNQAVSTPMIDDHTDVCQFDGMCPGHAIGRCPMRHLKPNRVGGPGAFNGGCQPCSGKGASKGPDGPDRSRRGGGN
jgi:hypothetical protein